MPAPDSGPYHYYFGGELFSAKHLFGNAALAEAIYKNSAQRYIAVLPQNLEQREVTANAVRDQDLRAVMACDLGLFHYDGPELDSGTVVEYMFAKFADIPSVLLRTDFRSGGDHTEGKGDAWNLMSSFYPRTKVIQLDSMALFQESLRAVGGASDPAAEVLAFGRSVQAGQAMIDQIAARVVADFDALLQLPPVLPKAMAATVYDWLALAPGLGGSQEENLARIRANLAAKQARGLL
jgi:nucleoside 2-deoxyribosyltransferase